MLLLALGASVSLIAAGRPELFRAEDSAEWAGAVANVLAVIVALGLGIYAVQQDGRRQKKHAHGAALVFYTAASEMLATIELIEDHEDQIRKSKFSATAWRNYLVNIAPLLPNDTLTFLPDLPEHTAKLLVLSAQRLSTAKIKLNIQTDDEHQLAERVLGMAAFMKGSYLPLGNLLHQEIFGDTQPAWRV
ncbi:MULTISPECIES: hypothetical protein [Lysobacteraceae]|uniref:hypothetical protein n=1 Tax=Lysobacteraceae TaxID=32033 RepID=UPI001BCA9F9D|nr:MULTISPECIES: hypothetical protein [Lysobacter]